MKKHRLIPTSRKYASFLNSEYTITLQTYKNFYFAKNDKVVKPETIPEAILIELCRVASLGNIYNIEDYDDTRKNPRPFCGNYTNLI